jgi:hypothetical protein
VELEEIHAHVDGITHECTAKVEQLVQLVVGISNALVELGMLPVQDIPQLPKSAQKNLTVASLLLEHLWEVQASDAGPWD